MRYLFLILCFCFTATLCCGQNITIKGRANASHTGKQIIVTDYADYLTYTKTTEDSDTIDKDGYFELKIQSLITKPIFITIENLVGKLYVQPDFTYGIYFPEKDSSVNNQVGTESLINLTVYTKDTTELNTLIFDFNEQYNNLFAKYDVTYLSTNKLNTLLDSFAVKTYKRYKHIKNPYFKKYLDYSFAAFFTNTSRNRTMLYKQFIDKKPILYNNYEYMDFFNTYFKDYLKIVASTKKGGSIYNSINAFADYDDLKNQFKSDKTITNDTLSELLLLKGLIDFYYSPDFDKQQIQSVIEQLYRATTITQHKKIALQMLQNTYRLQAGSNAPDFFANDKNEVPIALSAYKGKHIYLNFFSTESDESLKEMKKIIDLKKKFNDKVTFVSVCLNDSVSDYKAYLKSNPKHDWVILHQAKTSTAKQTYTIKTLSGFFFVNTQMQLIQSPALMPSEGIEYKFNALFKPKRKSLMPGIKP